VQDAECQGKNKAAIKRRSLIARGEREARDDKKRGPVKNDRVIHPRPNSREHKVKKGRKDALAMGNGRERKQDP